MSSPKSMAAKSPPMSATTRDIFVEAQKGNRDSLVALVKRIHDRLYRFCLYLTGNIPLAQDLCQETYLKLLEKIDTLQDPDRVIVWLFRISRNQFLDYLRSPKSKPTGSLETLGSFAASGGDHSQLLLVSQALDQLSPEDRFLALLIYLEGQTYQEAAEIVGITEDAVRCRVYRMRNQLDRKEFLTGRHKA